jgi:polyferredoxin
MSEKQKKLLRLVIIIILILFALFLAASFLFPNEDYLVFFSIFKLPKQVLIVH